MAIPGRSTGNPQLDALSAQIYNLPAVQKAINEWDYTFTYGGNSTQETQAKIAAAIKAAGLTVPEGYGFEIIPQGGGQTAAGIAKTPSPWEAVAPGIYITAALLTGGALAGGGGTATGAAGVETGGVEAGAGTAGAVLPSTTIGSGFVGPIAGGTGLTGAGVGGAGLTGDKILGALGDVGPVLGSAAAGVEKNNLAQDQLNLGRDRLAQDQYQDNVTNPGTRLKSAYKASMIANQTPSTHTGGPGGAGPVKFSGGFSNPAVAAGVKPQADDVVAQQLQEQLLRGSDMPKPTPPTGGAGSDLLGGAALATNILGAFGAKKTQNQRILEAMNPPAVGGAY